MGWGSGGGGSGGGGGGGGGSGDRPKRQMGGFGPGTSMISLFLGAALFVFCSFIHSFLILSFRWL